jgi:hypothetical protein
MGNYYPQIHKTDFKDTTLPVGLTASFMKPISTKKYTK